MSQKAPSPVEQPSTCETSISLTEYRRQRFLRIQQEQEAKLNAFLSANPEAMRQLEAHIKNTGQSPQAAVQSVLFPDGKANADLFCRTPVEAAAFVKAHRQLEDEQKHRKALRPDLKQLTQSCQIKEEALVMGWRPTLGATSWRPEFIGKEKDIPATEAAILDKLAVDHKLPGQHAFLSLYNEAFEIPKRFYPAPSFSPVGIPEHLQNMWVLNDGHQDAFRHAYWSARLTQVFGEAWAEQYTNAHEMRPDNPRDREAMDLYNNGVGRNIAKANPKATPEELAALVKQACDDGMLVVVNKNNELDWSDNVPVWGHGLADEGLTLDGKIPQPDADVKAISAPEFR